MKKITIPLKPFKIQSDFLRFIRKNCSIKKISTFSFRHGLVKFQVKSKKYTY